MQDRHLSLELPPAWSVVTESDVKPPPPVPDLTAAVQRALNAPIGTPALKDLVGPKTRVALVMDDPGRPTPIKRLVPIILTALREAGARFEHVTGLFAVGAHEPMSPQAMEARAGSAVVSQIGCQSFHCRDENAFEYLGRTRRHTPVYLNRLAVEADLRILVGTIEPHPQASYGGGFKNLLPGLAGARTIGHNHLLMPSPDHYALIGTPPDKNPMRVDLEEAGRMIAGPTLIVNVILDLDLEPVAVVCGDPVLAHRAGVSVSRQTYGVEMPDRADVVLVSAYPMERDLRQAGKSILNVVGACRRRGVIVSFMACPHGLGGVSLPPFPVPLALTRGLVNLIGARAIARLAKHIPGPAPEERFMINLGLQLLRDYNVLIFSPNIKAGLKNRFRTFIFDDQNQLFERAGELAGTDRPEVAVFHHGGVSFPVVRHPDTPGAPPYVH